MKLIKDFIEDTYLPKMPFWLIAIAVVGVVATWVPLAFIAKARTTTSTKPPVHIFQDMDLQPRFDAQSINPIFADQRSMRPNPAGTVSRRAIIGDAHYELGFKVDDAGQPVLVQPDEEGIEATLDFYRGIPDRIDVDDVFVKRGQEQFNIYCSACHGYDGQGNGAVNKRALELVNINSTINQWTPASNIIAVNPQTGNLLYGEEEYADGKLYNTINNGIRNMKGYGQQISVKDRWSIVAYIRALQISQHASEKDLAEQSE
ncbi:c-type cytochrome [Poriferisphaera corsica]|uniref:c-type cytochrome n=1 Tax=Poriferisphaera corsica TaxID=2528020 RepID=UPI0011A409A0|nr:cytochrome c [Poriferisphaera corsica]